MIASLYPPLELIRADFYGHSDLTNVAVEPVELSLATSADVSPTVPPYVADLIRRRVLADHAFGREPAAAGQIRAILKLPNAERSGYEPVRRTFGILLGANLSGNRWRGWLVAQEVDYATDRDLVLEDDDGPCAPEAAMVQTWNEIGIELDGSEPLLGKLAPNRLETVLRLAARAPSPDEFVASRPGRIGAWDLCKGITVLTGTPLCEADDPRHAYHGIYRAIGLRFPVLAPAKTLTTAPSHSPNWLERLAGVLSRPAWTVAALALVLIQGAWIIGMYQQTPLEGFGRDTVYRSDILSGPGVIACQTTIHAVFNPDSSFAEIMIVLRKVEATVVAGPSETGELWLSLPKDRPLDEALAMLKSSSLVQSAEISTPSRRECGK
jgi:hypothetical protein